MPFTAVVFQWKSATLRLLALQMELELHVGEHGNAPDSLDAIAKRYPEIVLDPFAPKPARFLYRARGREFEIYSVGPNGIDDGGRQFWTPVDFVKGDQLDFNLETMMSTP